MCNWQVETGRLTGISAEDYREFYLRAREVSTLEVYEGAFKMVLDQARRIEVTLAILSLGSSMELRSVS